MIWPICVYVLENYFGYACTYVVKYYNACVNCVCVCKSSNTTNDKSDVEFSNFGIST